MIENIMKPRVFDKVLKKMADDVELIDFSSSTVKIAYEQEICGEKVHPSAWYRKFEEVEFLYPTGLKDKNDVEIYAQDIVKDGASDVGRLWEISITPEYGITFTLLSDKSKIYYYEDFNKYHQDNLEVVGSKRKNPELLGNND